MNTESVTLALTSAQESHTSSSDVTLERRSISPDVDVTSYANPRLTSDTDFGVTSHAGDDDEYTSSRGDPQRDFLTLPNDVIVEVEES